MAEDLRGTGSRRVNTLHVLAPAFSDASKDADTQRWLARGNCLPRVPDARTATLRALFRFAGADIPVAALRHHAVVKDAANGAWVAADPAYIRSEANGARLMAWPITDLVPADAEALSRALRPLFGDAGTPLAVDSPSAWCVQLPGGAPPAEFTAPAQALGADMLDCLPRGDAGRSWRRLFNEAQIILHAHPVNAARVAAGKVPVNAVWFWGVGALPGAVDTVLKVVVSDDVVVHGLARVAGVKCTVPAGVTVFGKEGDAMLDLANIPASVSMWLPQWKAWLRERRFDAIDLVFADGERRRVRHIHRLRFWRRA